MNLLQIFQLCSVLQCHEKRKKNNHRRRKSFSAINFFFKNRNDIFTDYEKEFKDFNINYTFGGYHSLLAIIDDIKFKENETVLLPSYLCSSILRPFDARGVKYDFNKIDNNLTPGIHHIKQLLNATTKSIVFIDYMGKSQIDNVMPCKDMLAKQGVKIIQDCVQSIDIDPDKIYGDYAFNSFRKTTPFEGSVIISKNKMKICFTKGLHYKFLFYKRIGQILRYFHIHYNIFKPLFFLRFIEKAEELYQAPVIYKLPRMNKYLIRKIDFKQLIEKHKVNYNILLEMFRRLVPRTLQSSNFDPFAFFMVINNRDSIRKFLNENGVFCPIHWALSNEINKADFRESHDISAKALTIPLVDINVSNLNYLKLSLEKVIL